MRKRMARCRMVRDACAMVTIVAGIVAVIVLASFLRGNVEARMFVGMFIASSFVAFLGNGATIRMSEHIERLQSRVQKRKAPDTVGCNG